MAAKKWRTGVMVMVVGTVFASRVVMSDDISVNEPRQFTFSWPYTDKTDMAPRRAPSKPPNKMTATVCPVMGIGLNGTDMAICAMTPMNNEPSKKIDAIFLIV